VHDTSKSCSVATEVADCGAPGSCRTHLGPPQSIAPGGFPLCITTDVAGSVGGTIDIESGAFAPNVRVHSTVYGGVFATWGGGPNQGCPRCVGDPVENDGIRGGTCDVGPRESLTCDANATNGPADFGSTSFDCPAGSSPIDGQTFDVGAFPTSTGMLTRTLSLASPNCHGVGIPAPPCFCSICNNADFDACATNADCPLSGGNPGICGGKLCLGGDNHGTPCTTNSQCPSGLCGRIGEPSKPNACLDDTNGGGNACVDQGAGEAECMAGPLVTTCSNHPNRGCNEDADCDGVPGACEAKNRPCFPDNGLLGNSISVNGAATPPAGGIADPTDLAVLGCMRAAGSSFLNNLGGFPGLVRGTYPGRLLIVDPSIPTPVPTATPTPTSLTPTPTPVPSPCATAPAACRPPFVIGKSSLQLTNRSLDDKDHVLWKWSKGSATTLAELGDPVTSDEYVLCLYDGSDLRATMRVFPGGTCQERPCWRAKPNGFQYRNKDALPHGITHLTLRAGENGKASLQAKGKGMPLPMPALNGLAGTLRVQLRNRTSGLCWDTSFSPPFKKLTDELLKAKDG
jgi:hypothetical protein